MEELERAWPDEDRRQAALERLACRILVQREPNPPRETLTAYELDTLRALAAGLTERETATVLGRSYQGSRSAARNARRLLRAKTNAQAVAEAIRQGLIV